MVDDTTGEPSARTIKSSHPPLRQGNTTCYISNLPPELISYIIELSLPLSSERIKVLYATRMVARDWRNAIDSTPSHWNVVSSNLPFHINSTTIQRSGRCPLGVHFTVSRPGSRRFDKSRLDAFAALVAREVGRWSTVTLKLPFPDDCSSYLTSPAPLLRSLSVIYRCRNNPTTPVALFGGIAPRLEVLEVDGARMDWTASFIPGLRELDLVNMSYGNISTEQVLEILASTPRLDKLRIYNASLDHRLQPHQGPRAIIHLPNLKIVDIGRINREAAGTILSLIQAPSCTLLNIRPNWDEPDEDSQYRFPEPALSHFKDFQRRTIYANHNSTIHFFNGGMEWASISGPLGGSEFALFTQCDTVVMGVEWATRIIGTAAQELVHNLEMTISHHTFTDDDFATYHSISRCRSVTKLTVEYNNPFPRSILDLLGSWKDSEDGTSLVPGFPRLEVLVLRPAQDSWLDDLEVLVDRRFGGRESVIDDQVPSLEIDLQMWEDDDDPHFWVDMARLKRLRTTKGVRSINRFLFDEESSLGMLAAVYDGDAGP